MVFAVIVCAITFCPGSLLVSDEVMKVRENYFVLKIKVVKCFLKIIGEKLLNKKTRIKRAGLF